MTRAEKQKLWETRIAEYLTSGQSAKAWCAAHDVTPPGSYGTGSGNSGNPTLPERRGGCRWKDRFSWPMDTGSPTLAISYRELRWLLDGLSLKQPRAHPEVKARTII